MTIPLNNNTATPEEKLTEKLSELELKEKERQTKIQADSMNLPYIDLDKFPISQEAIKILSQEQAEAMQTVCFLYTGEEMRFGSLNPSNPQLTSIIKEIGEKYHTNVKIYLVSQHSFNKAFAIYSKIPTIIQMEGVSISEDDLNKFDAQLTDFNQLGNLIKETSLTETLNLIIAAALKFDASGIHIEAEETDVKVRMRIDGVLHDAAILPAEAWPKVNSRIKLLAELKLNIGDKPQDGRITIKMSKDKVDVRVSIVPSSYGESIVMRLLRGSAVGLQFEVLGLRGKTFNDLQDQMGKPNGMILSTGPTGSGKTTTLYAILNKLNNPENKIITLEDPIEYKLSGIVQSQVESAEEEKTDDIKIKKNVYSFARGLRAILRQDPDIVMVGEIRDLETAETAINAALTGHLILSTLHTNSSAGAIPRLLAMDVQSFLLAPSLNAIIGQRLIRKICQHCKVEDTSIDNTKMTKILNVLNAISPKSGHRVEDLNNLKFYKATGCDQCHHLGYRGRTGIFEVLTMSPEIEKMILRGNVSESEMEKLAVDNGMITMLQDGLLKALEGITSVDEVLKQAKE